MHNITGWVGGGEGGGGGADRQPTVMFSQPVCSHLFPVRASNAPDRTSRAPVRAFHAPGRTSMAPVREYDAPSGTCTAPVRASQAPAFPSIARVSLHYSRMSHHGLGEILVKSFAIKVYCPVPKFIDAFFAKKPSFTKLGL
jgi:hypothetical protein